MFKIYNYLHDFINLERVIAIRREKGNEKRVTASKEKLHTYLQFSNENI